MIRMRRECPEISWGTFEVLRTHTPVLALRYDWRQTSLITLHNFCDRTQRVRNDGTHAIALPGYGWRWLRVGGPDSTLDRSMLNLSDDTVI